jgi:hypothetical protein
MFGRNIRKALVLLKNLLEQESESTKEMLKTYYSYTQGKIKEEDLEQANKQLKELIRDLGFGFLTILPFAPITIPILVKLARKYEIDIVPEWFKESLKK